MNNIVSQFSIKDLENLSGIMAHTIRIWEKRYNILEPNRTESNIRFYDLQNLQKLLNVTLLYNSGLKISKIASLDEAELQVKVKEQVAASTETQHFIASLKLAMLNFDQSLFEYTYNRMVAESSFRSIFLDVFIPLLFNIGLEWQSNSITPAHEHFISNLIKQKLHINIERVQQNPPTDAKKAFVLFLPSNEIHELGLLYIHYELVLKGHRSVYLGPSVPRENLELIQNLFPAITFVSYFTVKPENDQLEEYVQGFDERILRPENDNFWILGQKVKNLEGSKFNDSVKLFSEINLLLSEL